MTTLPGSPSIESGGVSVTETAGAGRIDHYTVVLATRPTGDVTIEVTCGLPTAATVSPATATFAATTWSTSQWPLTPAWTTRWTRAIAV